jgi:hypothetical protein
MSLRLALGVSAVSIATLGRLAAAADYPRDASARSMIARAINERYLLTQFTEAEQLLVGTIEACENKCSPATIAIAWMYVGIVRSAGRNDESGANDAFAKALAIDPHVKLDPDLSPEPTRALFESVRAAVVTDDVPDLPAPTASAKPAASAKPPPPPPPDTHVVCPPGLPGCAAKGDRCKENAECKEGLECARPSSDEHAVCRPIERCDEDSDCSAGRCEAGRCTTAERPPLARPNWFGFSVARDFAWLHRTEDVCASTAANAPYRCYVAGVRYSNADEPLPADGRVPTVLRGFAAATWRILASYDRDLSEAWSVGVRGGLAFGGAPKGFLPVHAEARVTRRFLDASRAFRPLVFASSGIAQIDAPVDLHFTGQDDTGAPAQISARAFGAFGRFFVAGGGGLSVAPRPAVRLDFTVAALGTFPDATLVLEPSAAIAVGLPDP